MKNDNNISSFDRFMKDKLEHAEMQAPDVWPELSSTIDQPAQGGNLMNSTIFKGVVTTLVVGGVAAVLWFNTGDRAANDDSVETITPAEEITVGTQDNIKPADRTEVVNPDESVKLNINQDRQPVSSDARPDDAGDVDPVYDSRESLNDNRQKPDPVAKQNEGSGQGNTSGGGTTGVQGDLGDQYNALLNIAFSDTLVCKGEVCIITTSGMQLFDRIVWEINGERIAENTPQVAYRGRTPGKVMVDLLAWKDGQRYRASRYFLVVGASHGLSLYNLGDKGIRGIAAVHKPQRIAWHFGDHNGWYVSSATEMDHLYDQHGIYHVKAAVTDRYGCSDTVHKQAVKLPTAISPSLKDGKNDYFEVYLFNPTQYQITIRNMDGEVVFESDNIYEKWDGTNRNTGTLVPMGTYVYQIVYRQGDGPVVSASGKITVL